MKTVRVIGTGSYLPPRMLSNETVAQRLHLTDEAIVRRTGIVSRYWADPSQTTSDLAFEAAQRALASAGLTPADVGGIIVSTTSPDMPFPSTACQLQRRLGVRGGAAFDVSASCSGFLYAASMALNLLQSGMMRSCLVVAAEIKSRSLNLDDESTALLFGDGAGAVVLRVDESATDRPDGILGIRLFADGSRRDLIRVEAGGSRHPTTTETLAQGKHTLRMNGAPLFRIAVKRLCEAVSELLKEFGVTMPEVAQVVCHQANGRLLQAIGRRLAVPEGKLFSMIERVGNTSSASLPIALDTAVRDGRIRPGDLVVLGAFGGGLTWGTGIVRW